MSPSQSSSKGIDEIAAAIGHHGIHTVEVAVVDTYGHLRGKRVPAGRFISSVAAGGVNIADAVFVFDPLCEIVDAPTINMGTGYLDMHLRPDLSSFRALTHRPGYAIVFSDALHEDGRPHELDPRNLLKAQTETVRALGFEPVVATELECYLFTPDWQPFQNHVQYSSLTDALDVEAMVSDMRHGLLGAGIPVESSNPEYGPGQLEINFGPADPVTTADNTVLFKTIVKQVAIAHGARASFMPKPYALQSGSGMHIHTSLTRDGQNVFGARPADPTRPNETMAPWTAGLLHHARAMQLLGIPTPNGYRRVVANTFCPTHVHWGADNRTVMARLTMHAGNANRVEFRCAGADANAYVAIAGVLAAGADGIRNGLPLEAMATGDKYADPGDSPALPSTIDDSIAAFESSALASLLGSSFAENYLTMARNEQTLAAQAMAASPEEVSAWELNRYLEHS
jgi:glutamine synthetase